jgi:hypothetical protein
LQQRAVVKDRDPPIQPLVHFDPTLRVAHPIWAREKLNAMLTEPHGIVRADSAQVLEAEDLVGHQSVWPWAVGALFGSRPYPELLVEVLNIARQHRVCLSQ